MQIGYTIVESPLGRLLVAATARGVSSVKLGESDRDLERDLREEYPAAEIRRDPAGFLPWVGALVDHVSGVRPSVDVPVDVQATAFQWRVWRELMAIPYGQTRTYGDVARRIGRPSAVRAVARACATNPVALVIPCHRVVGKDGALTGYRWGVSRKRALIAREKVQSAFSP